MSRALVGAVALVALLAGCGSTAPVDEASDPSKSDYVKIYRQPLSDGRTVTCVVYQSSYHNAGISCDWAGAK